tara:strand:+ start:436 stop:642 length:207 start_codon:yes stop_codon:yes gene_type:complete
LYNEAITTPDCYGWSATHLLPVKPLTTGERLNGIQEVSGSIPLSSTDLKAFSHPERGFFCFTAFQPDF